jgi:hypothetical protein
VRASNGIRVLLMLLQVSIAACLARTCSKQAVQLCGAAWLREKAAVCSLRFGCAATCGSGWCRVTMKENQLARAAHLHTKMHA